jgi:hypothetical protein
MVKPREQAQVVAQLWAMYHGLVDTGRYLCAFVYNFGPLLATNDDEVTAVPRSGEFGSE